MRKWITRLLLAALLLLDLLPAMAAAEDSGASAAPRCRYYYQLEKQPGDGTRSETKFALYVERTEPNAPLLHTGSIALTVQKTTGNQGRLVFQNEEGWTVIGSVYRSTDPAADREYGVIDGQQYIYFSWGWDSQGGDGLGEADGRQFLGTLTVPITGVETDDVELLDFTKTASGSALVSQWQTAANDVSKRAKLRMIESVWRMPDTNVPAQGYYQGYYAFARGPEKEAEADICAVDLTAGWLGFTVGAYAGLEERPITVNAYAEDGSLAGQAVYPLTGGAGHFKVKLDLSRLGLRDGIYKLEIKKPEHVTATLTGLRFQNGRCDILNGEHVELPCGDVNGDGAIRQRDRASLTAPGRYGKPAKGVTDGYDLNGDGWVDQKDLTILIAPANYGKSDFIIPFTE